MTRIDPPSAGRAWFKAHGLGNDYLVFEDGADWVLTPAAVKAVCHRWEGVGSDGIVLQVAPRGDLRRLRMFNPDGSEFERSGNGLRVYAAFLAAEGRVDGAPFPVEVGGDVVTMQVHDHTADGTYDVSVDMGHASFDPAAVGFDAAQLDEAGRLAVRPGPVVVTPVSMGNPHCVVFQEDLSDGALAALGPALTSHPAFVNGANVQLAWPAGGRSVRIRIWERGVGHTFASGTSACAVAAAAVRRGLLTPGPVDVLAEGGTLQVDVGPDMAITLRGPVREVTRGELTEGFVRGLG